MTGSRTAKRRFFFFEKKTQKTFGILVLCVGLLSALTAKADELHIPVIMPLSGGAAFLGISGVDVLKVLESTVNEEGGINGKTLKLDFIDDQSSPQVSVQLTRDAILTKPPVILGSALVAMCNATAPLLANGPVDYCLSPAVHPVPGSYMYSSDTSTLDLLAAGLAYLRGKGLTRIAAISSSDASGQDFQNNMSVLLARPENAGFQFVENVRFNMTDVSVSAQLERVTSGKPQALFVWTTGSPVGTVFKSLAQSGLDVPVFTANITLVQLQQYASFLPKNLMITSPLFPPHEGLQQYDPRVEAAQQAFYAALNKAKLPIDAMAAHVWDPGRIVVAALRALGPDVTAPKLRAYLAAQRDFAGVSGIYNFEKVPQRGLDQSSTLVVRWDGATESWVVITKPGGAPL